jgi:toxin YoeB
VNKKLVFVDNGWDDYIYWQFNDKNIAKKIIQLLNDIERNGYDGIGKPEPLKHERQGWWSRRITEEHRVIYRIDGETIYIASCRYHYE